MTVKEWLNRGYKIDQEINALLSEREQAFNLACKATAPPCNNEKVSASVENGNEKRFVKYADYSCLINKRIDELYEIKREILSAISKIDSNTYRSVLTMRYIQFKTWEQIAECMNFSEKWVRTQLHESALNACRNILPQ